MYSCAVDMYIEYRKSNNNKKCIYLYMFFL